MNAMKLTEKLIASPLFTRPAWLRRFSCPAVFLTLSLFLILGVLAGSLSSVFFHLFDGGSVFPVFFSGIPSAEGDFFFSFSTLLLNTLIGLLLLFLLGLTVFGLFAVPLIVFLKGVTIGIGVFSFLQEGSLQGLGCSAFLYTPAAAALSLLLLLFASRALVFSHRLAKVSFSAWSGGMDLGGYCLDLLRFLSLAVALSLAFSLPAGIYGLFLP